ncbi:MAG TPA: precorrin-2 C(20)-methyltransferase [Steroidobacteraceae bacterium]
MSAACGRLFGIGVGPGPRGLLPVAAVEALSGAAVIYLPRARSAELSIARQCLKGLDVPPARLREIEFAMEPDRTVLRAHYAALAGEIVVELEAGRDVAYLTLGDPMTYSTYGYTLAALRDRLPALRVTTIPGVTSFAAAAAAMSWPIGEGKERVLILPCPDHMGSLRQDIESHDVVILMKIGKRLPMVLRVLRDMGIGSHCALASRIGLPGETLCSDVGALQDDAALGYLSTMLIRRCERKKRHQ